MIILGYSFLFLHKSSKSSPFGSDEQSVALMNRIM